MKTDQFKCCQFT